MPYTINLKKNPFKNIGITTVATPPKRTVLKRGDGDRDTKAPVAPPLRLANTAN